MEKVKSFIGNWKNYLSKFNFIHNNKLKDNQIKTEYLAENIDQVNDSDQKTKMNQEIDMKKKTVPDSIKGISDYLIDRYANNIPIQKTKEIKEINQGVNIIILGSNKVGKKTFQKYLKDFLDENNIDQNDMRITCTISISSLSDLETRNELFPTDKIPIIVHLVALDEKKLLDKNYFDFVNQAKKRYGNPYYFLIFTRSTQLLSLLKQSEEDDDEKEQVYKNMSNIIRITVEFYLNKKLNLKEVLFFEKEKGKIKVFYEKLMELLNNRQEIDNLKDEMIISCIRSKTLEDDKKYNRKKSEKFKKYDTEIELSIEKIGFEENIMKTNDLSKKEFVLRLYNHIMEYEYKLIEKFKYIFEKEKGTTQLRNYLENSDFQKSIIIIERMNKEFEINHYGNSMSEIEEFRNKILEYSNHLYGELIKKILSQNETLHTSEEIRKVIEKTNFETIQDLSNLFKGKCENEILKIFFKKYKILIE
jgi:hypothetical protein